MKKKLAIILACLLLIPLVLAGCTPGADLCKISGIEGATDLVMDAEKKEVSFSVATEVDKFNLTQITRPKEVVLEAFSDREATARIEGEALTLVFGLNTFFIKLSVTAQGKSFSVLYQFKITRLSAGHPSAEVVSFTAPQWKENYKRNEAFMSSNLLVVYSDNSTKNIAITADMLAGFDTATAGTKAVTITYSGKTCVKNIIVAEAVVSEVVAISAPQWKENYQLNEAFVSSNLLVEHADKTTESFAITTAMLTGFDTATAGTKAVTIAYAGKTCVKNIIVAPAVVKEVVSFTAPQWQENYKTGDVFVPSNLLVEYADQTKGSVAITADMLTGFDTTSIGTKTVTITYAGKTCVKNIVVVAGEVVVDPVQPSSISKETVKACGKVVAKASVDFSSGSDAEKDFKLKQILLTLDTDEEEILFLQNAFQKAGITEAQLSALTTAMDKVALNVLIIYGKMEPAAAIPSQSTSMLPPQLKVLLDLMIANDADIAQIKSELATVVNLFTPTQLGIFAKEAMGFVTRIFNITSYDALIAQYNEAILNNPSKAELIADLNKQLEFFDFSKTEYQLQDKHYVEAASTILNFLKVVLRVDLANTAKVAKTVFDVIDIVSVKPINTAALAAIFASGSLTLNEGIAGINQLGQLLEDISYCVAGTEFSKLVQNTQLSGGVNGNAPNNILTNAMVVLEESAAALQLPAALLKNITAADVAAIYLDIDALIKVADKTDTNPEFIKKSAVVIVNSAKTLNRLLGGIEPAKMLQITASIKLLEKKLGLSTNATNESYMEKALRLVTELSAFDAAVVATDQTKAQAVINTLNGFGSTLITGRESRILVDYYGNMFLIKKGTTNQDIIDSINLDFTFRHNYTKTNAAGNVMYYSPTVFASISNLGGLDALTTTGFHKLSITNTVGDITATETFDVYVYDQDSYKNFVVTDKFETVIVTCPKGAVAIPHPIVPFTSSSLSFTTFGVSGNGWIFDFFNDSAVYFTIMVDFDEDMGVVIKGNTSKEGLQTGFLEMTDEVLGKIVVPFQFYVTPEVPAPTTKTEFELALIETYILNDTTTDFGYLSYIENYVVRQHTLTKADLVGLDLTTAGPQKVTITLFDGAYTESQWVYVRTVAEAQEVTRFSVSTSLLTYSLNGSSVFASRLAIAFKGQPQENPKTAEEWNDYFIAKSLPYIITVEGFAVDTRGTRDCTVTLKTTDLSPKEIGKIVITYKVLGLNDVKSVNLSFNKGSSFVWTKTEVSTPEKLTAKVIAEIAELSYILQSGERKTLTLTAEAFSAKGITITLDSTGTKGMINFTQWNLAGETFWVHVIADVDATKITSMTFYESLSDVGYKIVQNTDAAALPFQIAVTYGYGYKIDAYFVGIDGFSITGYDKTQLGEQTITITCQGFTDTFKVTVVAAV